MKRILLIGFIIFSIVLISNCENSISILDEVRSTVIGPIGDFQLRQESLEVLDGSTITFLDTPTNGTRSIFFTIRNTGTGDVVLTGANEVEIVPSDYFTASISDSIITPGSSVVFSILFDPPETSTYSAEVIIETDIEEFPIFSFYVEGTGTAVDTTSPTGTISIESGDSTTNSLIVDLSMTSDDGAGSGVTEMKISNDAGFSGDWSPYSSTFSNWSMPGGADGARIVYAKFRDASGNESGTISDSITYETDPPGVSSTIPTDSEDEIIRSSNIRIQFDEPMDESSITASTFRLYRGAIQVTGVVTSINPYQFQFNPNSWLPTNTSGVIYTAIVYSTVKDLAGNALGSTYSWNFTVRPDDEYEGSYTNNDWEDNYSLWTTSYYDEGLAADYPYLGGNQAYGDYGILWDEDWYKIYIASTDYWPEVYVQYKTGYTGANIYIQVQDGGENIVASDSGLNSASADWELPGGFSGGYYYIRIYTTGTYSGRWYDLSWDELDQI